MKNIKTILSITALCIMIYLYKNNLIASQQKDSKPIIGYSNANPSKGILMNNTLHIKKILKNIKQLTIRQ